MTNKQAAKAKLDLANHNCAKIHEARYNAYKALENGFSTNGYGIYHDRFAVRNQLLEAKAEIEKALKTMDGIDWPNNDDYDLL